MNTVREATLADVDSCVATIRAAFADYPFTRHTIAAADHLDRLAASQRLFIEEVGIGHGRVWMTDDASAVSAWTTPESTGLEQVFEALQPRLASLAGDRATVAADVEAALAPHRPAEPSWFLGTVGVDPDHQGRGLGRQVIEPGLRAADEAGSAAYLETSLEKNVSFYCGLGFEVTAVVDLPHDGPRTWAMRRKPSAPGRA